jgi:hypothetical protein
MLRHFRLVGCVLLVALQASSSSAAELTAIWPGPGEMLNTGQVELVLDFSAPVDPATATADAIRIYRPGSQPPTPGPDDTLVTLSAVVPEVGDTRVRVVPAQPLADGDYVYGSASPRSGAGQRFRK